MIKTYHLRFLFDDDWYVVQALEDESLHTQARALDEAVLMGCGISCRSRGSTPGPSFG